MTILCIAMFGATPTFFILLSNASTSCKELLAAVFANVAIATYQCTHI